MTKKSSTSKTSKTRTRKTSKQAHSRVNPKKKKRSKNMGGQYESTVQQQGPGDKGGETIIQQPPGAAQQATASPPVAGQQAEQPPPAPPAGAPAQQTLRFHLSGAEVHFHDDANRLKAAIPVADYYFLLRQIQMLQVCNYLDQKFNTLLTFTPYIDGNVVECYAQLRPVHVGRMLTGMLNIKKG